MATRWKVFGSAALTIAAMTVSSTAMAGTGCNGVVNVFVWGCAPWDNNNGSKFAYFKKSVATVVPKKVEKAGGTLFATTADGRKLLIAPQDLARAQKLLTDNGAAVISNDGGSFSVYTGQ